MQEWQNHKIRGFNFFLFFVKHFYYYVPAWWYWAWHAGKSMVMHRSFRSSLLLLIHTLLKMKNKKYKKTGYVNLNKVEKFLKLQEKHISFQTFESFTSRSEYHGPWDIFKWKCWRYTSLLFLFTCPFLGFWEFTRYLIHFVIPGTLEFR